MSDTRKPCDFGHLYLMQAECGMLKIGRSIDPEKRRQQVSLYTRCPIELVAVLEGRGADEDSILQKLRGQLWWRCSVRKPREWFSGDDWGRRCVTQALGIKVEKWPFKWNERRADELCQHINAMIKRKSLLSIRSYVQSSIRDDTTDENTNAFIYQSLPSDHITMLPDDQEPLNLAPSLREIEGLMPLPNYLGNASVARSIGPPGWVGPPKGASPGEIVIAALEALTWFEQQAIQEDYARKAQAAAKKAQTAARRKSKI